MAFLMESFQALTAAPSLNFNLSLFGEGPHDEEDMDVEPMMDDIEAYINSLTRFGEDEDEASRSFV